MNETPAAQCYRHPDRLTRIVCRRCQRPICGECMITAAVGFQCPHCVKAHTRATRQNQGPYGGEISASPRRTSIILIVINALVWGVLQVTAYANVQYRVTAFLGLRPQGICETPGGYFDVTKSFCQAMKNSTWIPGVADGAWWQVLTSIFTHVSILHLGMNCLTLWFLGPSLESFLGRTRFLTTYFVAGLTGSLAVYWLSAPHSLSYGGSGSLFGVMGALLIILWRQKIDVKQLLMWLVLNLIITFTNMGQISWQAHMGGLVGGALIACVWAFTPRSDTRTRTQWILIGALLLVVAIGMVVRTVILA